MTVYTVSCPPAGAIARCVAFWRVIGIKRESAAICKRFADIGWSGAGIAVTPGQVENQERFRDRDLPDNLSDIPPSLLLGGLAVYLTLKAVRTQLCHLNEAAITVAARSMPDAERVSVELWRSPWDTAIQRACPGKDSFAHVSEYLHTALYQQGILLALPRLVDGEELPEDHPLSSTNIAQMRGSFLDPVTKFLPSKEWS